MTALPSDYQVVPLIPGCQISLRFLCQMKCLRPWAIRGQIHQVSQARPDQTRPDQTQKEKFQREMATVNLGHS